MIRVRLEQVRINPREARVGLFAMRSKYRPGFVVYVNPIPFVVLRFQVSVDRGPEREDWSAPEARHGDGGLW